MPPEAPRSKMSRWRAATLVGVHVLAGVHFLHWKLAGRTLAPVEPSEMFDTLHLGVITVGFLFMVGAVLATAFAGRFFCGWGCHILALQDGSAWLLRKAGIPTRPVRSRTLVWVPALATLYLFVWPQVERLLRGEAPASLHVVTEADGWTSFTTNDLLRSFPGLGMTLFTFAVCGFAVVYFLGSRSFCAYACPYGAIFAKAERVAPLRIVAGPGECSKCGACIASCHSSVRVIEEIDRYGTVMNANCMRDLDCVSVCPTDALKLGVTTPPVLRGAGSPPPPRKSYDFTRGEDLLMAAVFSATIPIIRGLYDAVALLLALTLAALVAYAAVVSVRLGRRERVTVSNATLKAAGKLTPKGRAAAVGLAALGLLVAHSAYVRVNVYLGEHHQARLAETGPPSSDAPFAAPAVASSEDRARAIVYLERAAEWGLVTPRALRRRLALLYQQDGATAKARGELNAILAADPDDEATRLHLAKVLIQEGRASLAERQLERIVAPGAAAPRDRVERVTRASANYLLADLSVRAGDPQTAKQRFGDALAVYEGHAESRLALGAMLAADGDLEGAVAQFESGVALRPTWAAAHNNLAAVLVQLGRFEEALASYERVVALAPESVAARCDAAAVLLELGRHDEAERAFKEALSVQADCAAAQAGLRRVTEARDAREDASP